MTAPSHLTAALVTHDLTKKVTYVTLTWPGEPEKKLGLPIPFGTKLDDVAAAAEKTLHDFAAEMAAMPVKTP